MSSRQIAEAPPEYDDDDEAEAEQSSSTAVAAAAAAQRRRRALGPVEDVSSDEDDDDVVDILPQLITKKRLNEIFGQAVRVFAEVEEVPANERSEFHEEKGRRAKKLFKQIVEMCSQKIHAIEAEIEGGRAGSGAGGGAGGQAARSSKGRGRGNKPGGGPGDAPRSISDARRELSAVQLIKGKALANLGTMYGSEGRVKTAHSRFVASIDIFQVLRLPAFESMALRSAVANVVSPQFKDYRRGVLFTRRRLELAETVGEAEDLQEHLHTFMEAQRRENRDKVVVRVLEDDKEEYVLGALDPDQEDAHHAAQAAHFARNRAAQAAQAAARAGSTDSNAGGSSGWAARGDGKDGGGDVIGAGDGSDVTGRMAGAMGGQGVERSRLLEMAMPPHLSLALVTDSGVPVSTAAAGRQPMVPDGCLDDAVLEQQRELMQHRGDQHQGMAKATGGAASAAVGGIGGAVRGPSLLGGPQPRRPLGMFAPAHAATAQVMQWDATHGHQQERSRAQRLGSSGGGSLKRRRRKLGRRRVGSDSGAAAAAAAAATAAAARGRGSKKAASSSSSNSRGRLTAAAATTGDSSDSSDGADGGWSSDSDSSDYGIGPEAGGHDDGEEGGGGRGGRGGSGELLMGDGEDDPRGEADMLDQYLGVFMSRKTAFFAAESRWQRDRTATLQRDPVSALSDTGKGSRAKGTYETLPSLGRGVTVRLDDDPLMMARTIADEQRRRRVGRGAVHQFFQSARSHVATHVALREASLARATLLWLRLKAASVGGVAAAEEHGIALRGQYLEKDQEEARRVLKAVARRARRLRAARGGGGKSKRGSGTQPQWVEDGLEGLEKFKNELRGGGEKMEKAFSAEPGGLFAGCSTRLRSTSSGSDGGRGSRRRRARSRGQSSSSKEDSGPCVVA